MKIIRSIARSAALLLICARSAAAAPAHQALRQMDHTMWTARDGAPQAISALAQHRDGTLWIGSETGLVNFDGRTFRPFRSAPGGAELPLKPVESILIARDGTLWVGFWIGGVAHIDRGHVTVYRYVEGIEEGLSLVQFLSEDADGRIWAIGNLRRLIRFDRDGTWRLEKAPAVDRIGGIHVDRSNALWLVQGGYLYKRQLPQPVYERTSVPGNSVFGFTELPDGRFWMTDVTAEIARGRTQLIDQSGTLVYALPFNELPGGLVRAPDGSLIMPLQRQGVRRFAEANWSGPTAAAASPAADVFTHEDGLSSNAIKAALVDSDGNIWLGGARGLDRLRPMRVTPVLPTIGADQWSVCASEQGDVWLANSANELYRVSAGARTRFVGVGDVFALACGENDRAWFANSSGVSVIRSGKITALPMVTAWGPHGVFALFGTRDNTLYAMVFGTAAGTGIWRFRDERWTKLPGEGLRNTSGFSIYVDSRDRLWVGYGPFGGITLHEGDTAKALTSGNPGLEVTYAFLETPRGLFAAGTGLAVLRDSRFELLRFADPSLVRGVRGLAASRNGDLWLNTATGIAHVPATELDSALANSSYQMKAELINEGDFAGTYQSNTASSANVGRDAEGQLWFATRTGVIRLDPDSLSAARRPPSLTIRAINSDQHPIPESGRLEPGTRTLEIQYLGVNLTSPEKVIYRYRLAGFDESWQEAGSRTEAIYTRVSPGTYTFHVIASNGDGIWTDPVTSRSFTVLPAFYQTRWFAAAVTAAVLLLLIAIYRLRVRQFDARLQERVNERTRIARELHDTLLQSFHGVMFRFQAAANVLPDRPLDAKQRLETALKQGTQAIREGRDAVQGLRDSTAITNGLAVALRALGEELAAIEGSGAPGGTATVGVAIQGTPQALHPIVRDDIYRIGSEALRNAFRHARARRIEVEIRYDAHQFQLRVRDDGRGIDAGTLDAHRAGHFGLPGMRERAEQIGGHVEVWSKAGMGTEVAFTIPGATVYAPRTRRYVWSLAGRRQAHS